MDPKEQAHQSAVRRPPPPLPPRQSSTTTAYDEPPPAYDSISDPPEVMLDRTWTSQDPRSTSTDSLTPDDSNVQGTRRKLLCIYIHGFMGNETSFRSFPAHVHNLLTVLLAETHVVHTKIYPRYRSKRNISYARDDFSRWLEPHESEMTDVVLLGHSMGGLISAEVATMAPAPPASRPLKHRLVGTINFDVPFLGMHPGVVKSGLASLFAAPPEAPGDKWEGTDLKPTDSNSGASATNASASTPPLVHSDTLWQPGKPDPNYNPSFQNDVVLPVRKGWSSAWHFINKHSDSLGKATKQLVTSHMEFGGAMANYVELKVRYGKVRALEEDNVAIRKSIATGNVAPPRVRFVNYYTASTGRPKKPKSPQREELPDGVGSGASLEVQGQDAGAEEGGKPESSRETDHLAPATADSNSKTPGQNDDIPSSDDDSAYHDASDEAPLADMAHVDPTPHISSDDEQHTDAISPPERTLSTTTSMLSETATLPPIPEQPAAPAPLDVSFITDKDTRKLVEKEHARAVKNYEKAVKDREKVIKDRAKLEEKRERKAKQESEKAEKEARKARAKAEAADAKAVKKEDRELTHSEREELRLAQEKERMEREGRRLRGEPSPPPPSTTAPSIIEPQSPSSTTSPTRGRASTPSTSVPSPSSPPVSIPDSDRTKKEKEKAEKPPKDRMFCTLPPKDSNGQRDPCWVRIFMKDVDEVGAHCGLFFVDERYERLVGDVAEKVEGWVREGGH